jgi:tetratricopeptide (TPR) repeat protein
MRARFLHDRSTMPVTPNRLAAVAVAIAAALAPVGAIAQTPTGPPATQQHKPLSAEVMYRLLVGDIALQRGQPAVAARAYLEAARETRDPAIARRATELALAARQRSYAMEAAKLWSEIEPEAERPKQLIAALESGPPGKLPDFDGEGADLQSALERALAQAATTPGALGEAFMQLPRLLAQQTDRQQAYRMLEALAKPYPTLAEAQFAVALAAFNAGGTDQAMADAARERVDRALALRPGWERAVLLKSEVLARTSPADAIAYLEAFRKTDPTSRSAAGALAQLYVEQKRFADARAVFEKLRESDPGDHDLQFGLAVIEMQMKDYAAAEQEFSALREAGYGEAGVVELYLAQLAEEMGRFDVALERYKAVPAGDRGWTAQLRVAGVLAKQGKLAEARAWLDDLPAVTIEQRVQTRQAESQLLRDAGDNAGAYEVLEKALGEHPDEPDLLYDIAMVAEKLDRLDVVEARLGRLIALRPDNAQALNALGYTLVDRTDRTGEGLALIEKAHRLQPTDPFILDSMGWAHYRLGQLDDAERYLRQAMNERPDAEIAAHLGEVLWKKGDIERAREVWQSQLKSTPDNALLRETMRRLAP